MADGRIVIVGAGMGGLASAVLLASQGFAVSVIEKEESCGGKVRRVAIDGADIDGGPTVFTLRDVFDSIFDAAGRSLDDYAAIRPAEILARHAWDGEDRLDLFADPERSADAIGVFAGAREARGFRAFSREADRIYTLLENSFLKDSQVWPFGLMKRIGLHRLGALIALRPYESLWDALGDHFHDPRMRQLFARYSTYCGSSPFRTPATLMLIAHVESRGVWLIEGGISALAGALRTVAEELGAEIRCGDGVAAIDTDSDGVTGVLLESGERIAADGVIVNADPAAIGDGRFGAPVARAARGAKPADRSLSACVTYAHAETGGFPLVRHNVFFSPDYKQEFRDLHRGRVPADPSVYVCAQDRDAADGAPPDGRERLQIIVNAPADGDRHIYSQQEIERCMRAMRGSLARCGLTLEDPMPQTVATPSSFEALFPSTGGALYGRASHGWAASFLRQSARTKIPGLYCAGGSTHPGAGVPMAALSGQLAAATLIRDRVSMPASRPAAMAGGISTQSATTAVMG